MATRRLNRDITNFLYVIWFELSNGKKYYVNKDFIFIELKEPIEFDTFLESAKKYKLQGAKCVTTNLWNKYLTSKYEKENGGHIVRSSFAELNSIKRDLKYCVEGKYYFNPSL